MDWLYICTSDLVIFRITTLVLDGATRTVGGSTISAFCYYYIFKLSLLLVLLATLNTIFQNTLQTRGEMYNIYYLPAGIQSNCHSNFSVYQYRQNVDSLTSTGKKKQL